MLNFKEDGSFAETIFNIGWGVPRQKIIPSMLNNHYVVAHRLVINNNNKDKSMLEKKIYSRLTFNFW